MRCGRGEVSARKSQASSIMNLARLIFVLLAGASAAADQTAPPPSPEVHSRSQLEQQQQQQLFPGVSRDLASFCSARPSLPIDLAPMVVHIKRNTSFNYKLYLFSGNHVFQTGQLVPRDDFRIHSFPVRVKSFGQFLAPNELAASGHMFKLDQATKQFVRPNGTTQAAAWFESANFFRLVPLAAPSGVQRADEAATQQQQQQKELQQQQHASPSTSNQTASKANEHIQFDRDDQVSLMSDATRMSLGQLEDRRRVDAAPNSTASQLHTSELIMPVASFSSFHVNLTYLVRKDFGQAAGQLLCAEIDADKFRVSKLYIISDATTQTPVALDFNGNSLDLAADFGFLSHQLLRDPNIRIVSISQVYEEWITRNFYTLVYIQRRHATTKQQADSTMDRLIFRDSSPVLLGAQQLDYNVKASTFVTEKNGLHYYLEFLTNGRFHVGAIDWTRKPFKMIDAQSVPIKPTQTQFDNEELLLCPPAVCHSAHPIDEIITFGRLVQPSEPTSSSGSSSQPEIRLHLHDWYWPLSRRAQPQTQTRPTNSTGAGLFSWQFERAKRNDIRVIHDKYGFALSGHEIDASYRVHNELYLMESSYLIAINFSLPNETVTSSVPIGDEFQGLSSSLLDPITGAYFDQQSNQIFFFKGDRYVGYNFKTKRPLEDFQLPATLPAPISVESMPRSEAQANEIPTNASSTETPSTISSDPLQPLVSTLPVVGILGRQHHVDAIYHDVKSSIVYIFSGMHFYTYHSSDFKNGAFKSKDNKLPVMRCINVHFLDGCIFDEAFPNLCHDETDARSSHELTVTGNSMVPLEAPNQSKPSGEYIGKLVNDQRQRKQNNVLASNKLISAQPVDEIATGDIDTELLLDERRNKQSSLKAHKGADGSVELRNHAILSGQGVGPAGGDIVSEEEGDLSLDKSNFNLEQQLKLRSIAARGGFFDYLIEKALMNSQGNFFEPFMGAALQSSTQTTTQERIVIYLLLAMVTVTIVVTVAMIIVIINWTKMRSPSVPSSTRKGNLRQRSWMNRDSSSELSDIQTMGRQHSMANNRKSNGQVFSENSASSQNSFDGELEYSSKELRPIPRTKGFNYKYHYSRSRSMMVPDGSAAHEQQYQMPSQMWPPPLPPAMNHILAKSNRRQQQQQQQQQQSATDANLDNTFL